MISSTSSTDPPDYAGTPESPESYPLVVDELQDIESHLSPPLCAVRPLHCLGKRGYAEASDKIKLSLALPHQSIFSSADVVQVNICAATGDMGILANHVPVQWIKKWVVSGGFATVHPGNKLTVNVVEAANRWRSFHRRPSALTSRKLFVWLAATVQRKTNLKRVLKLMLYEALQHAVASK
ncbi:unnamed protein product [Mycena citricolor]|uniref:F-ATPase delta subunit n=1 Tax=Mycena citricolor TaxID=2018698 RepID=A0AAD2Q5L2_9AGAR|nr:unnamed protein product [Mycena citricolor]